MEPKEPATIIHKAWTAPHGWSDREAHLTGPVSLTCSKRPCHDETIRALPLSLSLTVGEYPVDGGDGNGKGQGVGNSRCSQDHRLSKGKRLKPALRLSQAAWFFGLLWVAEKSQNLFSSDQWSTFQSVKLD